MKTKKEKPQKTVIKKLKFDDYKLFIKATQLENRIN